MYFLSNPIQHKLFQNASASGTKLGSMAEEAMLGGMDDERRRLEQFRSWHDEAFLYINQVGQLVATLSSRKKNKTYWRIVGKRSPDPHQAVTQEADDIGRPDVALLM